jgi:hypothetical protein
VQLHKIKKLRNVLEVAVVNPERLDLQALKQNKQLATKNHEWAIAQACWII